MEPTNALNPFTIPPIDMLVRHKAPSVWFSTKWTSGDGNCMFDAFARGFGDSLSKQSARAGAIVWISENQELLVPFLAADEEHPYSSMEHYLTEMAKDKVWGDALALHGLALTFNVRVEVLKKSESGCYSWANAGTEDETLRKIWLYLEGNHYENLVGEAEVNNSE